MPSTVLIVAVVPGQSEVVLRRAADAAARYDASLLCVSVDPGRTVVTAHADGTVTSALTIVDVADVRTEEFDPELAERIGKTLDATGVPWATRALVGDPVHAIADLADEVDAALIVVGTRPRTLRGALGEFLRGSVAAGLSHRQDRPILVVPTAPAPRGERLPWEER